MNNQLKNRKSVLGLTFFELFLCLGAVLIILQKELGFRGAEYIARGDTISK